MAKRRLTRQGRDLVRAEYCKEMLEDAVEACLVGNHKGARGRLEQARGEGCLIGQFSGLGVTDVTKEQKLRAERTAAEKALSALVKKYNIKVLNTWSDYDELEIFGGKLSVYFNIATQSGKFASIQWLGGRYGWLIRPDGWEGWRSVYAPEDWE